MRDTKEKGGDTAHVVDRHSLQEARAAARRKADDLFQLEMERITKPLDDQLTSLTARRDQLEAELKTILDDIQKIRRARNDVLGIEEAPVKKSESKRERKSAEDLAKIANSIKEYVKRQPEPISGGAIREFLTQFHGGYKIQSPIPFLDKYAPGHGVNADGVKAATRYS